MWKYVHSEMSNPPQKNKHSDSMNMWVTQLQRTVWTMYRNSKVPHSFGSHTVMPFLIKGVWECVCLLCAQLCITIKVQNESIHKVGLFSHVLKGIRLQLLQASSFIHISKKGLKLCQGRSSLPCLPVSRSCEQKKGIQSLRSNPERYYRESSL